jgi:IclR family KDG regulon transcriptional repressor
MTITAVEPIRDDRAAIDKAFSLLSTLGEHSASQLGVSELARRTQLSNRPPSAFWACLSATRWVERAERGCAAVHIAVWRGISDR